MPYTSKTSLLHWGKEKIRTVEIGPSNAQFCIFFISGRDEFIEKYDYLPKDLKLKEDILFLSYDLIGQGLSSGNNAKLKTYDDYLSQAECVLKEKLPQKIPYLILGHSTGALIALYGVLKGVFKPSKLLLLSPFFGLPAFAPPKQIVYLLHKIALLSGKENSPWNFKKHSFPQFEKNDLSHSLSRYERITSFSYPQSYPSFSWLKASLEAIDLIFSKNVLSKLASPVFILAAEKDQVIGPKKTALWAKEASRHSQAKIKLSWIKGAYHELLSEEEKYYQPTCEWLKERISES